MQELWGTWQVGRGHANSNRSSQWHEGTAAASVPFCLSLAPFPLISPLPLCRIFCWTSGRQMFIVCLLWKEIFFPPFTYVWLYRWWYQEVRGYLSLMTFRMRHVFVERCVLLTPISPVCVCVFILGWILWLTQFSKKKNLSRQYILSDLNLLTFPPP